MHIQIHRKRNKSLGLLELVAIALGGMVGGGIFTILGISVSTVGYLTPLTIIIGGLIALLAAYSYIQLGLYYRDEGASFSFVQKTFPNAHFTQALIGWLVIFGYVSTLALYSYTFSAYVLGGFGLSGILLKKIVAISIILLFTGINVWSVNGMGKIEDLIVYTKLVILFLISAILIKTGIPNWTAFTSGLAQDASNTSLLSILMIASVTFVAYEGFQLVINAVNEMSNPEKNIKRAIYLAVSLAVLIYIVISAGALLAIPKDAIIQNKEYALAAGAKDVLGSFGQYIVIIGAILATCSAISGTVFGASRQMAVVAQHGYMPHKLAKRNNRIPVNAVLTMAASSIILILIGGLELILEFGSITFLLVSLLMSYTNIKLKKRQHSTAVISYLAFGVLTLASIMILTYEFTHSPLQMALILLLYAILAICAYIAKKNHSQKDQIEQNDPKIPQN